MGGIPPLGYDPHPDPKVRELVVNAPEATTITTLFRLYDRYGSLSAVEQRAAQTGLRSKRHLFKTGRRQGGNPLSRGQIHKILLNPVYLGKIRHKDLIWPGKHKAIIDQSLWDSVQAGLKKAAARPRGRTAGQSPNDRPVLLGKLKDDTGDQLTPSHSVKNTRRYRYYISNRLISGGPDPTGWRLPAAKLETVIAQILADHLASASETHALFKKPDIREYSQTADKCQKLVERLRQTDPDTLRLLLKSGVISPDKLKLTLNSKSLAAEIGVPHDALTTQACCLEVPFRLRRRGVEAKLIAGSRVPDPDPVLCKALSEAHRWTCALGQGMPLKDLSRRQNHHPTYISNRARLAFLSPRIQTAIAAGYHPVSLTLEKLIRAPIPFDWTDQERRYGF